MLRWVALVIGLAASGCVLGDGIDLPSTSTDGSGPSMEGGGSSPPPNGGISDDPGDVGTDVGSAAGSGGSPCCDDPPPGDAGSFGGEAP